MSFWQTKALSVSHRTSSHSSSGLEFSHNHWSSTNVFGSFFLHHLILFSFRSESNWHLIQTQCWLSFPLFGALKYQFVKPVCKSCKKWILISESLIDLPKSSRSFSLIWSSIFDSQQCHQPRQRCPRSGSQSTRCKLRLGRWGWQAHPMKFNFLSMKLEFILTP